MAGISDKALGKLDSKYKFDGGVNFEEDYGVNLYTTFYRGYDPQIGRFSGVDILSEKTVGMSVYGYCGNNPVMFGDPMGSDAANMSHRGSLTLDGSDIGDAGYDPFGWANEALGGGGFGTGGNGGTWNDFYMMLFYSVGDVQKAYFSNFEEKEGRNKYGDYGIWISYSFSINNAVDADFGKTSTLDQIVFGKYFAADRDGGKSPPSSNSFHFVTYISADSKDLKYSGGWQIAAINGLYFKYRGTASPDVDVKLPLLYFGLPVLRKDGTNYTYEVAQKIATQAVSFAEFASGEAYADGDYSSTSLQGIYLNALKTAMGAYAGTATTSPGINLIINPKDITAADYSIMDTW